MGRPLAHDCTRPTSTWRTPPLGRSFVTDGWPRPADVLTPIMQVDPLALDLRTTLIRCLAAIGSERTPAVAHYKSLAAAHVRELGVPAPSFREVATSLGKERG